MKKTATIETKTLTPEEKRAKRAAYAREYYAKNKEARIAAVKKCRAAKKAMNPAADGTEAKKPGRRPAPKKAVNALADKPVKASVDKTPAESKELRKAYKTLDKAIAKCERAKQAYSEAKNAVREARVLVKKIKAEAKAKK
jgi:hypothetical protein